MRIITGSARGRRLTAPEGTDVRPTAEVTKEAVFSAIHFEVEGARMLDLFAGTGQMGLCLLYTSPSPRDSTSSRMPSSA